MTGVPPGSEPSQARDKSLPAAERYLIFGTWIDDLLQECVKFILVGLGIEIDSHTSQLRMLQSYYAPQSPQCRLLYCEWSLTGHSSNCIARYKTQ